MAAIRVNWSAQTEFPQSPREYKSVQRKSSLDIKLTIAMMIIPFVVGCANVSTSNHQAANTESDMVSESVQEERVSAFLASAAPSDVSEFASTPWGENVIVQAGERYFSASGRYCRKLTVFNNSGNESLQLACEIHRGSWEPVRLVTQLLDTR